MTFLSTYIACRDSVKAFLMDDFIRKETCFRLGHSGMRSLCSEIAAMLLFRFNLDHL